MLWLVVSLSLAQTTAPVPTNKLVIWGGGKTRAEAETTLKDFQSRGADFSNLTLASPYPSILDSSTVEGLKPGFFVVALGVCASEQAPGFRLFDFLEPATYTRDVALPLACPDFSRPEAPENQTYALVSTESRQFGRETWSFAWVSWSRDVPEGESSGWVLHVAVRRRDGFVAMRSVSDDGGLATIEDKPVLSRKGVSFEVRSVNPSCAMLNPTYTERFSRSVIRLDGDTLDVTTRELQSESGPCN